MWDYVNSNYKKILGSGLNKLLNVKREKFDNVFYEGGGNYIISNIKGNILYVGQTNNIQKRLKQHKKYQEDFIQFINTNVGKKELEEFGIVNLKPKNNKSHLNKSIKYNFKDLKEDFFSDLQSNYDNFLIEGEDKLLKMNWILWKDFNIKKLENKAGVYIIQDRKNILYIGESVDLNERIKTHSKHTYFSAFRRSVGEKVFGFELLRKENRKRYFNEKEDKIISDYIFNDCYIKFIEVKVGRLELEEFLINKYKPFLNKKL